MPQSQYSPRKKIVAQHQMSHSQVGTDKLGHAWTVAFVAILVALTFWPMKRAFAQACYQSSIVSPTPFMGNHDEIFQLADGSIWKVQYEYQYLYEYYATATICPSNNKLIVKGKALNVTNLAPGRTPPQSARVTAGQIVVVAYRRGCQDYFLADGPHGIYLLEWYGGY
jgi:hypothetical protein